MIEERLYCADGKHPKLKTRQNVVNLFRQNCKNIDIWRVTEQNK